jgi:hypothetical protein
MFTSENSPSSQNWQRLCIYVTLSPEFNPPILKGIKVHPDRENYLTNGLRQGIFVYEGKHMYIYVNTGIHR